MQHLVRTARTTGALYLGLAATGGLSYLAIRPQLAPAADPGAIAANLIEREGLARLGVALELGAVLTQALVAVWFYRLFRAVNPVAAAAVAGFGFMNAAALLGSSAALSAALDVALEATAADAHGASTVAMLYSLSNGFWAAGNLFFGLWLIPMGTLVIESAWMPRALGYALVVGGVAYVASAFTTHLVPAAPMLTESLAYVATVGELWIIGYLLIWGVRRTARG